MPMPLLARLSLHQIVKCRPRIADGQSRCKFGAAKIADTSKLFSRFVGACWCRLDDIRCLEYPEPQKRGVATCRHQVLTLSMNLLEGGIPQGDRIDPFEWRKMNSSTLEDQWSYWASHVCKWLHARDSMLDVIGIWISWRTLPTCSSPSLQPKVFGFLDPVVFHSTMGWSPAALTNHQPLH